MDTTDSFGTSGPEPRPPARAKREQAVSAVHDVRLRLIRADMSVAPDGPLVDRMRSLLLGSTWMQEGPDMQALRGELRSSVAAYARLLRDEGEPPERMVVLVKEAVFEGASWDHSETTRSLAWDVVRWSVEAYYE